MEREQFNFFTFLFAQSHQSDIMLWCLGKGRCSKESNEFSYFLGSRILLILYNKPVFQKAMSLVGTFPGSVIEEFTLAASEVRLFPNCQITV